SGQGIVAPQTSTPEVEVPYLANVRPGSIAAESVKPDGAVCPLMIRLRRDFCSGVNDVKGHNRTHASQQTGAIRIDSSTMNVRSHCGASCDPRWEVALRTWPFSSAGTLAAIAIVAETGDATLGDHLYLHRVRSLETPQNAHSSCRLT